GVAAAPVALGLDLGVDERRRSAPLRRPPAARRDHAALSRPRDRALGDLADGALRRRRGDRPGPRLDRGGRMRLVTVYAAGRLVFGAAALLAPGTTGRALAGEGGALPDAQAFLRGMGGRE